MLTCRVDNNVVRVFEVEEEQLRKWSKNGDMACCGCDSRIIYNHGEIKDFVYLRHYRKTDKCEHERDTEMHDKGKLQLYEYIKSNPNFKNVDVEKVLETGQIADIYFEYEDKKIALEYQCTPIATPLLQRSRKYRSGGYEVIWVFGIDNYNIKNYKIPNNDKVYDINNYKTIASEREILFEWNYPILYYKPTTKQVFQGVFNTLTSIPKRTQTFNLKLKSFDLKSFDFVSYLNNPLYDISYKNIIEWVKGMNGVEIFEMNNETQYISPTVCFKFQDIKYSIEYNRKLLKPENYEQIVSEYDDFGIIPIVLLDARLHNVKRNEEYLAYQISSNFYYDPERNELNVLEFIGTETWYGYMGSYNMQKYNPCTSKLNECWILGDTITNSKSSEHRVKNDIKRHQMHEDERMKKILKDQWSLYYKETQRYNDEQRIIKEEMRIKRIESATEGIIEERIILIDGYYKVPSCIRFKFMKNLNVNDEEYMLTEFMEDIRVLKKRRVKTMFLMIPKLMRGNLPIKRNDAVLRSIVNKIKSYGFKNIEIYKEEEQ